jgi:hypothetical protein
MKLFVLSLRRIINEVDSIHSFMWIGIGTPGVEKSSVFNPTWRNVVVIPSS